MTSPRPAGTPRAGDPYGTGLLGSALAPALAVVGLLVVALLTVNLLNGELPLGRGPGGNGGAGPDATPAPSNVVVVPDEETVLLGSIVYAKAGNIWVQDDAGARQLTSSGKDSMPSWSPDGAWVYYIQTERERGFWPVRGRAGTYDMSVPHLRRVRADGSGEPEELLSGRFREGRYTWHSWIRQPVVSPDGRTIALVTDQPNPDERSVILQLYNPETERFSVPDVPVTRPLGHQDPAWRHDGRMLLYVRNDRDGARGAPVIWRYDLEEQKAAAITTAGYLEPSYAPDGRAVAATRTSAIGTDIVILHPTRGTELARITTDGASWAPVWSPAGDAIAFLHMEGQIVDLRMAVLRGPAGEWTVEETIELTQVSGLDAASRPDWFVPPEDLPAVTPPPSPAGTSAPAGSPPGPS